MARMDQIVSLAIEVYTSNSKAMDTSREKICASRWSTAGYSMKEWAVDVLKLLPDDRARALEIVKHITGEIAPRDRRRVGQYVGQYYRQIAKQPDLIRAGNRFFRVMK